MQEAIVVGIPEILEPNVMPPWARSSKMAEVSIGVCFRHVAFDYCVGVDCLVERNGCNNVCTHEGVRSSEDPAGNETLEKGFHGSFEF